MLNVKPMYKIFCVIFILIYINKLRIKGICYPVYVQIPFFTKLLQLTVNLSFRYNSLTIIIRTYFIYFSGQYYVIGGTDVFAAQTRSLAPRLAESGRIVQVTHGIKKVCKMNALFIYLLYKCNLLFNLFLRGMIEEELHIMRLKGEEGIKSTIGLQN